MINVIEQYTRNNTADLVKCEWFNEKESGIVYDKMKGMLKNKDKMKKVKLLFKQSFSESGMYSYLVPNLKKLYSLLDSLNYHDKYMMLTYKNNNFDKELIKIK